MTRIIRNRGNNAHSGLYQIEREILDHWDNGLSRERIFALGYTKRQVDSALYFTSEEDTIKFKANAKAGSLKLARAILQMRKAAV